MSDSSDSPSFYQEIQYSPPFLRQEGGEKARFVLHSYEFLLMFSFFLHKLKLGNEKGYWKGQLGTLNNLQEHFSIISRDCWDTCYLLFLDLEILFWVKSKFII